MKPRNDFKLFVFVGLSNSKTASFCNFFLEALWCLHPPSRAPAKRTQAPGINFCIANSVRSGNQTCSASAAERSPYRRFAHIQCTVFQRTVHEESINSDDLTLATTNYLLLEKINLDNMPDAATISETGMKKSKAKLAMTIDSSWYAHIKNKFAPMIRAIEDSSIVINVSTLTTMLMTSVIKSKLLDMCD
ncbi:hypothetical protein EVAR_29763_1 [Eumeta japonica]|uniref:Uncharacterized protein n=1 Tax=Eumeta variegata TaxID=151549 RepID=A0A4C1WUC6_EUMVA|nr:hypothetical protein EVAR_29763_1 [Eumeta japonica]